MQSRRCVCEKSSAFWNIFTSFSTSWCFSSIVSIFSSINSLSSPTEITRMRVSADLMPTSRMSMRDRNVENQDMG